MKKASAARGFTMIEILLVVAVIAILGTIALTVGYQSYVRRAQASDIVLKYDAIRSGVGADLSPAAAGSCDELTKRVGTANLKSEYVRMAYGFEAVAGGGYRPVLTVCAKADANGDTGVKVARGAYDTLEKTGRMEKGAVLTETLVSFAVPLTDGGRAACAVAPAKAVTTACGDPVVASASTAPVAAQPPAVTTPPAVTAPPALPPEEAKAVTAMAADLLKPENRAATIALMEAIAKAPAGQPISVPGPNAGRAQVCNTPSATKDSFIGDCSKDFGGMCGNCFVDNVCEVTCGVFAPMSPAQREALQRSYRDSLRPLCEGGPQMALLDLCAPFWASGEFRK